MILIKYWFIVQPYTFFVEISEWFFLTIGNQRKKEQTEVIELILNYEVTWKSSEQLSRNIWSNFEMFVSVIRFCCKEDMTSVDKSHPQYHLTVK